MLLFQQKELAFQEASFLLEYTVNWKWLLLSLKWSNGIHAKIGIFSYTRPSDINTVIAQVTRSSDINNIIHQVMISIMHSKQKLFFSKNTVLVPCTSLSPGNTGEAHKNLFKSSAA